MVGMRDVRVKNHTIMVVAGWLAAAGTMRALAASYFPFFFLALILLIFSSLIMRSYIP